MSVEIHTPGKTVRYEVDFSEWASGTTLDSAVMASEPSLTISSVSTDATSAYASISGVEFGKVYRVTCTATLGSSETPAKTFVLRGDNR